MTGLPRSISCSPGWVTIKYFDARDLRDQLILLTTKLEAEISHGRPLLRFWRWVQRYAPELNIVRFSTSDSDIRLLPITQYRVLHVSGRYPRTQLAHTPESGDYLELYAIERHMRSG